MTTPTTSDRGQSCGLAERHPDEDQPVDRAVYHDARAFGEDFAAALAVNAASACSPASMAERLRKAGLRPTRQRVALGCLLYARGHRHVSAEILHAEAIAAKFPVSLATVYNTLHQLTESGLLREVAVEGVRTYFDTNTSQHHHFFIEGENRLIDIEDEIAVDNIPEPPPGMSVESFQVIVRVRAKP